MTTEAFPQQAIGTVEARRAEIERQRDAQSQYFKVTGIVEVVGVGEAQVELAFPVYFAEQPILHFGGELAVGSLTVVAGSFPQWSATMHAWYYSFKPDGTKLYVGGILGVVTFGDPLQVMDIHWSVEGVGLRNPAISEDA